MMGKILLLGLIGFAGGISVAGGVFAFISILEMLPRLAAGLHMARRVYHVESCVFWGGLAGTVLTVFQVPLPVGRAGLALFGLFTGIFVGCLAMALAETLKVIPVMVQRTRLSTGLPMIVLALALGKALACFYQLYFRMRY